MKAHTISSVPMTFEEVGKEGEEVVGKKRRWKRGGRGGGEGCQERKHGDPTGHN